MTSQLWGAAKVAVAVFFELSVEAPSPLRAAERVCNGTLLQIQGMSVEQVVAIAFAFRSGSTLKRPTRMLR